MCVCVCVCVCFTKDDVKITSPDVRIWFAIFMLLIAQRSVCQFSVSKEYALIKYNRLKITFASILRFILIVL